MQSSQSNFHQIFSPTQPHRASSVLLLVENSEAMANIWYDMRDHCLKPLLREFEAANRNAPVKAFAVESLPLPSPALPQASPGAIGSIHHGLGSIQFNCSPNNRLSTEKVNAAIDLLSSVQYGGGSVTRHLIMVAASAPIDNPFMGIRQYAWFLLAEKLQKASIFCHLILARNGQDMSSLIGLHDKTRWLQGAVELHPAIEAVNHDRYLFKFAGSQSTMFLKQYPGFPLALPLLPREDEELFKSQQSDWHSAQFVRDFRDGDNLQALKPGSQDPFLALPGFGTEVSPSFLSSPLYSQQPVKLEEYT